MRVHELAKELGLPNKTLMARLGEMGVSVTSHMNAVPEEIIPRLRSDATPSGPATPPPATPKKAEVAAPAPERSAKHVQKEEPAPAERPRPAHPAATRKLEISSAPPPEPQSTPRPGSSIIIRGAIVVKDLAERMGMKPNQLIAELMHMNVLASINERLDLKAAQQIVEKHGFVLEHEKKSADQKAPARKDEDDEPEEDAPQDMAPRHPVVTFLGHIDHGKTSLLDHIRQASVAKSEAGGITQHIGAYTITRNGHKITFLDTPGHAAFTAMRARGANLTDIAIVVIASDDGIMPQTLEAIKHVQAANTAILVAINKMDLPSANPDRVMKQLQEMGLTPEEWGGTVICCKVSAQTGEGMDQLLEMILLQSEMMELKANPKARAEGYVIEARMEQGMGPTATMLVTRGTLRVGDTMLCGSYWGRIKALIDDHGEKLMEAGPASPVKCLGLSGIPQAGEKFRVCKNDKAARAIAEGRRQELRAEKATSPKKASLDELFQSMSADKALALRIILKCDTQGSLEAIQHALSEISSSKVSISVILEGIGNITMNDILLASASNAVIMGFNVAKEDGVPALEKREGVEVRLYGIIYEILDEIRRAMTGMLSPTLKEKPVGRVEVRQIFDISKKGKIAGCMVASGRAAARCKARVKRKNDVLYEGSITTLKRFQDDVSEVREGMECGVRLDNFTAFEPGDIIEFFEIEEIPQEL